MAYGHSPQLRGHWATYDIFDRRIMTTVDGTTASFAYSADRVWADFDTSGQVAARYLHGTEVDEPLARFRPGEGTSWYLADRLGTIRDQSDAAGSTVNHIDYDSYGSVVLETNPALGDRFKFTARELDGETGLYYYRARYYDSRLGRFISEDSIGFDAGDTNLQRYVCNNPVNQTDPTGLQAISSYAGIASANVVVAENAITFGGDEPVDFIISEKGFNFRGNPTLSGSIPVPGVKGANIDAKVNTREAELKAKVKAQNGDPTSVKTKATIPFGRKSGPLTAGDRGFTLLVVATAATPNIVASFDTAIFLGVATELAVIADYADGTDAQGVAEVSFSKSIPKPKATASSFGVIVGRPLLGTDPSPSAGPAPGSGRSVPGAPTVAGGGPATPGPRFGAGCVGEPHVVPGTPKPDDGRLIALGTSLSSCGCGFFARNYLDGIYFQGSFLPEHASLALCPHFFALCFLRIDKGTL